MIWRSLAISACLAAIPMGAFAQNDDKQAIKGFEGLIEGGKYVDAAGPLATYLRDHPRSWQALYQLGYVDFRLHRFQDSVTLLSRSLVIHQDFAESHKILAFDLNILGRSDLAVQELRRAIALEPESFECHYELGRIYYDRGSYLNSVHELEKAKALDPSAVKTYHNLGLAYAGIGENGKAVESFEEALRLNDKQTVKSAWPLIDYGAYFNLQGEYVKARDMLQQAIAIGGQWDQAFDELSKAYRGLGQKDLAIDSLKRAIAINPAKPEYHYALARLYTQANEKQQAEHELAIYEQERKRSAR